LLPATRAEEDTMGTYGYMRVSTEDQTTDAQSHALSGVELDRTFRDEGISGMIPAGERPGFKALLAVIRPGDEVIVWKLDRLGRSTRDVLATIDDLTTAGVAFRSLTDHIDTSGPMGRAMLTILAAFNQLERDTIAERTRAGLAAARAKGVKLGGRKPVAATDPKVLEVLRLRKRGLTVDETAKLAGVGVATVYRYQKLARKAPRTEAADTPATREDRPRDGE
jgi:DNA invertase Pin-like site-specific DNA recombinase